MLKEITRDKTFIIAEAGVNHNGELALAMRLVDEAKKTGADAVKFQTWKTDDIIVAGTERAEYQKNGGAEGDQYAMLKALELSYDDFLKLRDHAAQVGIVLFSTPDDADSMDFLVRQMNVTLLKAGSAELTNLPHLRKMASYRLPLIISTGMGTFQEVHEAVRAIEEVWPQPDLGILHCTTAYPTMPADANLRVVETYRKEFPEHVIGFSDHTEGILAAPLAVALGGKIIEKHFTLDNVLPGPDHKASLNPVDFAHMVRDIRLAEKLRGSGEKMPTETERQNKKVVERFWVAAAAIEPGQVITEAAIAAKRTTEKGGIGVSGLSSILAKKAKRSIPKNHVITAADIAD